jgi:beta-lactam-binding protein with PASTA domain
MGQDWRSGEALLREKGLRMRVVATRNDQNQPHGVIIDQSPMPGESVEMNFTVGVSVGGSPGEFGTGGR